MDLHYSQTSGLDGSNAHSFTTLWIYTILKLAEPGGERAGGFTTLWIYTILKLVCTAMFAIICFTTLWIYTILKRGEHAVL